MNPSDTSVAHGRATKDETCAQYFGRYPMQWADDWDPPIIASVPEPIPSPERYSDALRALVTPVENAQKMATRELEACVAALNSRPPEFKSFQAKREFTVALNQAVRLLAFRFVCPTCGEPATLSCVQGSTRTGAFIFGHSRSTGPTTHGGRAALPELKLVAAGRESRK